MINNLEITNQTRGKLPSLPFVHLKDAVLGKKYELSIVFCSSATSKKLNNAYRGKNKPTNVLSFPLTKNSGEIFVDLAVARREAPSFGDKFPNFVGFLLIHGMLHLKGFDHGSTMERYELKFRKKFKL